MSKPHLVACLSCARHVRVSEAACPFCGAVLAESLRASAPPEPPGVRLARAALFAFGAGTLAIAPGCGSSSTPLYGAPSPVPDAGIVVYPPYGIAPMPDAGSDDGGDDGGITALPMYGISPVPDAGDDDGGVRALPPYGIAPIPDAGEHDGGLRQIPPYGIAPASGLGEK
jgi:hypothetical protein